LVRDALCWPPRKVAAEESRKEGNSSPRVVRDDDEVGDEEIQAVKADLYPRRRGPGP